MNPIRSIARCAAALLLALAFVACHTPTLPTPPATPAEVMPQEMSGAPDWVTKSCRTHWDDDSEAHLCAVGAVAGTLNPALARTAAIARARTELARSIETQVQALLKDYQSTATGGGQFAEKTGDEQYISDTSKQITDTSIAGTMLENSWVSPNGTYYVMISLDLETFRESIGRDQSLPESTRSAIAERAKAAFDELAAEIDKQKE
jgi:hypothetical protein